MAQSRTTKLSKLLLVLSTVLILVPFVINSHRHPEGPRPPEFHHGPFPMAMERPMREGMRHRERSVGAAMPEGVSDRKVMPMPAQADDVAPVLLPRGDMPHPPPHGRRQCMKGVLAGVVGVVGLVAGATESRKAVTVFIVVIALAFTASTAMSIFRAHHKVESCRAQQSIVALGRDFHPEMPQQMPMRPAFDRPMPNQLDAQASSGMAVVNANVDLNTMDRADGVNQIQPVSGVDIVEVEEIDIEIEVRDDSASTSSDAVGGAGVLPSSRRAAKALHKRGPWGHGRRHNELPLNGHHGHHGHPGGNDCERAVKHRTAHKVGCSIIITAVFLIIARLLRKSIAADEEAAGVTAVATTKCGGEVYEGVPVKCSSDDVVVV